MEGFRSTQEDDDDDLDQSIDKNTSYKKSEEQKRTDIFNLFKEQADRAGNSLMAELFGSKEDSDDDDEEDDSIFGIKKKKKSKSGVQNTESSNTNASSAENQSVDTTKTEAVDTPNLQPQDQVAEGQSIEQLDEQQQMVNAAREAIAGAEQDIDREQIRPIHAEEEPAFDQEAEQIIAVEDQPISAEADPVEYRPEEPPNVPPPIIEVSNLPQSNLDLHIAEAQQRERIGDSEDIGGLGSDTQPNTVINNYSSETVNKQETSAGPAVAAFVGAELFSRHRDRKIRREVKSNRKETNNNLNEVSREITDLKNKLNHKNYESTQSQSEPEKINNVINRADYAHDIKNRSSNNTELPDLESQIERTPNYYIDRHQVSTEKLDQNNDVDRSNQEADLSKPEIYEDKLASSPEVLSRQAQTIRRSVYSPTTMSQDSNRNVAENHPRNSVSGLSNYPQINGINDKIGKTAELKKPIMIGVGGALVILFGLMLIYITR